MAKPLSPAMKTGAGFLAGLLLGAAVSWLAWTYRHDHDPAHTVTVDPPAYLTGQPDGQ